MISLHKEVIKMKHEKEDDNNNEINDDDLKSFLLRARLSDMNFSHVWKVMPSLGWKFNGSEYISPDGMNVGTSLVAMERLDEYALDFLTMSNRNPGIHGDSKKKIARMSHSNDTDTKLRRARNDLLIGIFANLDSKSRKFEIDNSSSDNDSDNDAHNSCSQDSDDNDSMHNNQGGSSSGCNNNSSVSLNLSATVNEPGTEQYFKKHKPRRSKRLRDIDTQLLFTSQTTVPETRIITKSIKEEKEKDRSHNTRKETNITTKENIPLTKITWPLPKDNVNAIEKMMMEWNDEEALKYERRYAKRSRQFVYSNNNSSKWKFLLSTNHNLLFHGFGSKRLLLNDFATELKSNGDVLTLDGNDRDISISSILDVIVALFLNDNEPPTHEQSSQYSNGINSSSNHLRISNNVKRAIAISKTVGMTRRNPIYIVIHNIDSIQLRSHDAQSALAALAVYSDVNEERFALQRESSVCCTQEGLNERLVRLVASIDHVDASLFLWDTDLSQQFSWIWKRTDTYFPYYEEVETIVPDESRKIKTIHRSEALDFIFIKKVLKSLAPKYEQILKILGTLQLSEDGASVGSSNTTNHQFRGFVDYKEWKKKCFEKIVTNKEGELKNMMKELIDHKMIERKIDESEGKEYIRIPVSKQKVRQVLQSLGK